MLHILWLILKFILILLGIVLGLILLAVLLLLFCPVRYQASVSKEESGWKDIQGGGTVSWLFHGVALKAEWKDGKPQIAFYLFGIPVSRLLEKHREKKAAKTAKVAGTTDAEKNAGRAHAEISDDQKKTGARQDTDKKQQAENKPAESSADRAAADDLKNKTENNTAKNTDTQADSSDTRSETGTVRLKKISENPQPEDTHPKEQESVKTKAEISEQPVEDKENKKESLYRKIVTSVQNKVRGIRQKLKNIRNTLQKIRSNVNWWKAFFEHPRVKAAISLVWKHAKFLLKHIFPTRTEGKITFSSEDPAISGTVLAVLGMTIPFHKNCVEIVPLFNGENYLRGNISVRGRIYGFVFVRAAVVIYFDKNIKYVIKRWKTRRA